MSYFYFVLYHYANLNYKNISSISSIIFVTPIWHKMLYSSLDARLTLLKMTSPQNHNLITLQRLVVAIMSVSRLVVFIHSALDPDTNEGEENYSTM